MGKKGHDLPKNLRQELVLNILEQFSGDTGISTSEIFELLENRCPGVNRRTLYRDLEELSGRFPIYDVSHDGKTKWFIRNDLNNSEIKSTYREVIQKELLFLLKKKDSEDLAIAL
jgi:Fe2+ or Zn2+ uptake regulation protein